MAGGLLFGAGMVIARGCPLRMTVLSAQGSLRALVRDPNRKGAVENAIGHTQTTALKSLDGKRSKLDAEHALRIPNRHCKSLLPLEFFSPRLNSAPENNARPCSPRRVACAQR